jgi:hypothetical protein
LVFVVNTVMVTLSWTWKNVKDSVIFILILTLWNGTFRQNFICQYIWHTTVKTTGELFCLEYVKLICFNAGQTYKCIYVIWYSTEVKETKLKKQLWGLKSAKFFTENYLSLIFRKINDFVHSFILDHKSVNFTILFVNFTILYC